MMKPNGNGHAQLLFWVLGIAIAILFAAVGLIVTDIRGDIQLNDKSIHLLELQVLRLERDLREEQHLTEQLREWHVPRLARIEELVYQLQQSIRPQVTPPVER